MTEAQWRTCDDPASMLQFLRSIGRGTDRKLRLFAVACCQRGQLVHEVEIDGVDVAERYADGLASYEELCQVHEDLDRYGDYRWAPPHIATFPNYELFRVADECSDSAATMAGDLSAERAERQLHADFLRCIFGTLAFSAFSSSGLTPTVRQLAGAIYEDRVFDRMPILADALEECGVTDRDMLEHCRSSTPHVRGCWVVDLLLDKR